MKKILLLVLTAGILSGIVAGCSSSTSQQKVKGPEPINIEVSDAPWIQMENILLPQLKAETPCADIDSINSEIKRLYDGYFTEQMNEWEKQDAGHGPSAEYGIFRHEKILSVYIKYDGAGYSTRNWQYAVYNINPNTGKKMGTDEVLDVSGFSLEDIEKQIEELNQNSVGKILFEPSSAYSAYIDKNALKMILPITELPYGNGSEIRPQIITDCVFEDTPITFYNVGEECHEQLLREMAARYGMAIQYAEIVISFGETGFNTLNLIQFKEENGKRLAIYALETDEGISCCEFPADKMDERSVWRKNADGKYCTQSHLFLEVFKSNDEWGFKIMAPDSNDNEPYYLLRRNDTLIIADAPDAEVEDIEEDEKSEQNTALEIRELQTITQEGMSVPLEGLFKRYTNAQFGITAEISDGDIFINYDLEKLENQFGEGLFGNEIGAGKFKVKGLKGECTGLFAGDIGQDIHPVLAMLLEDGTVQILDLLNTVRNGSGYPDFQCSPQLEGFENIVSFINAGGGEYENEGEIRYSYTTVYGIDKNGERHEVEPFFPTGNFVYRGDDETCTLYLSPDYTVKYIQTDGEQPELYYGTFKEVSSNEERNIIRIAYHMTESGHSPDSLNPISLDGDFTLDAADYDVWEITSGKGLQIGNSPDKVVFKRSEQ